MRRRLLTARRLFWLAVWGYTCGRAQQGLWSTSLHWLRQHFTACTPMLTGWLTLSLLACLPFALCPAEA